MPNQLDEAIAAGEAPKTVEMFQVQFALMGDTTRVAQLAVPTDMTELEALSLIANVLAVADKIRLQAPKSRLVVPRFGGN